MSKLTFEYIKANCVSGETILISVYNNTMYFTGWTRDGRLMTESDCVTSGGAVGTWYEHEIKGWTIKAPAREVIELFLTEHGNGNISTCDKDGNYPDYDSKKMLSSCADHFKINRRKEVYRRIYADTFEECTE